MICFVQNVIPSPPSRSPPACRPAQLILGLHYLCQPRIGRGRARRALRRCPGVCLEASGSLLWRVWWAAAPRRPPAAGAWSPRSAPRPPSSLPSNSIYITGIHHHANVPTPELGATAIRIKLYSLRSFDFCNCKLKLKKNPMDIECCCTYFL